MKQPGRQKRAKKSDRILWSQQSKDSIMCDYAIGPVDEAARQMDRKWGVDRLVELVSVEMATKYGSAMAKLNAAIDANDPEECKLRAEVVIRGLAAMDAEAERLGAQRASTEVWEFELDGVVYAIMKDGRSWPEIKAQRPDVEVLTMREVLLAYRAWKETRAAEFEAAAKQIFPGAEVTDVKIGPLDDPIPF
jgi:hypothetical protein